MTSPQRRPEEEPVGLPPAGRRARPARALKEDHSARNRLWAIIAAVTVLLVVIAAGVGYYVNRVAPITVVTTTPTPTPAKWKLQLPVRIDGWSRDANTGASPTTGADKVTTVTAPYRSSDGKRQALVLMARPATDLRSFMLGANMNVLAPVEDAMCGISGDTNLEGCAIMRDDTAILVMDMGAGVGRPDLISIARSVGEQASR